MWVIGWGEGREQHQGRELHPQAVEVEVVVVLLLRTAGCCHRTGERQRAEQQGKG